MKLNIPNAIPANTTKKEKPVIRIEHNPVPTPDNVDYEVELVPMAQAATVQADAMSDMLQSVTAVAPQQGTEELLHKALFALDAVCDGAHEIDDVGFNGTHARVGKKIASKVRNGGNLTTDDIVWLGKALPYYKNTQLPWLNADQFADAINDATLKALNRADDYEREAVYKPLTYADARSVLSYLETQPNTFADSIRRWQGQHTAKQQPYVIQLVQEAFEGDTAFRRAVVNYFKQRIENNAKVPSTSEVDVETTAYAPEQTSAVSSREQQTEPATERHSLHAVQSVADSGSESDGDTTEQPSGDNTTTDVDLDGTGLQRNDEPRNNGNDGRTEPVRLTLSVTPPKRLSSTITPDKSQQNAIDNLRRVKYGCLTGAAGTGKTTIERMLVEAIEDTIQEGNLAGYGKLVDPDNIPKEKYAPLMAFCAYTGKAMQQMKRALPRDYHGRCFTIHKLLGYHPIWEDVWDEQVEQYTQKRKFIPFYDASNKMPWQVIFIDEASMCPIWLWEKLFEACNDDCRIYMIGDINQLPPVHGRSVFGFALEKWPSFELTTIHRQKGEDNPIVDNAWRILRGEVPVPVPNKFDMIELPRKKSEAIKWLYKTTMYLHQKGEFNPVDQDHVAGDVLALAQNVDLLGQVDVNKYLAGYFNPPPPMNTEQIEGRRTIIIAGRQRHMFAIGDKVMATVNNHEIGVTNGMTGRIVDITVNGKFGAVQKSDGSMIDLSEMSVEDMLNGNDADNANEVDTQDGGEEEYGKRAASHILHIDFGLKDHTIDLDIDSFEEQERLVVDFSTTGEVNSIQLAYAATTHKLQGSEAPTIIVVCHSSTHRMLFREWLYTAATRGIKRVVMLYDTRGMTLALNRQRIKGANLKEKARAFIEWTNDPDQETPTLPEPEDL